MNFPAVGKSATTCSVLYLIELNIERQTDWLLIAFR